MKEALEDLLARRDLSAERAEELLETMTAPGTPAGLSGALLAALRAKGETADEIRGFASAMRRLARKPRLPGSVGCRGLGCSRAWALLPRMDDSYPGRLEIPGAAEKLLTGRN